MRTGWWVDTGSGELGQDLSDVGFCQFERVQASEILVPLRQKANTLCFFLKFSHLWQNAELCFGSSR